MFGLTRKSEEVKRAETEMLRISVKSLPTAQLASIIYVFVMLFFFGSYMRGWIVSLPLAIVALEILSFLFCRRDRRRKPLSEKAILKYILLGGVTSAACSLFNTSLSFSADNYGGGLWNGVAVGLLSGGVLCFLNMPKVAQIWAWVQFVCNAIPSH